MFWLIRCKVICGMFNFNVFDICLIFMEYLDVFLGFVRLKFLNYILGEKMFFL